MVQRCLKIFLFVVERESESKEELTDLGKQTVIEEVISVEAW